MPSPSTHDPLAEGTGWRELDLAPDGDDRWPFRPPLVTRRATEVPSLVPEVWEAAVAKAQRVYRRTGVRSGTPEAPQWAATRGRRRVFVEADRFGLGGRVTVEYVRPEPRPWLLAVALLCWPTALVGAIVLLARPAGLIDWAMVGGLIAGPLAMGAAVAAVEWVETLGAAWRARRVLRAVRKASRTAKTVWVAATEIEDLEQVEAVDPEPALLPEHVSPTQWLSTEEMEDLDGASAAAPEPETTLVWPVETRAAPEPEVALVWPAETRGTAPEAPAPSAFRDVPFSTTLLDPAPAPARGDGVRPRGDGVGASDRLPQLDVIHLSELEAVPEPVGGDGLAGPIPELAASGDGLPRRAPTPAAPRPPEPRPARIVPAAPAGASDVFTEWHPTPPWAWE